MKKSTVLFVCSLLFPLFFLSCEDESKDPENQPSQDDLSCYVQKLTFDGDVNIFHYSDDNKIQTVTYPDEPSLYTKFEYNEAGQTVAFKYFDNDVVEDYDTLIYRPDGKLDRIEYYFNGEKTFHPMRKLFMPKHFTGKQSSLISQIKYEYTEGELSKTSYYTSEGELIWFTEIETDEKGNVVKETYYSSFTDPAFYKNGTAEMSYDDKNHPFSIFGLVYYEMSFINNALSITEKDFDSDGSIIETYLTELSYEYNENNYPVKSYLSYEGEAELYEEMEYYCE